MVDTPASWVARLVPAEGTDVDTLLAMHLGLDIWERHESELVVAADERQLVEIERRRLATVERMGTVEEFTKRRARAETSGSEEEEWT